MENQFEFDSKEKSFSQISKRDESYNTNRLRLSVQEEQKNERNTTKNFFSKEKLSTTERKNETFSVKDNTFNDPSNTLKKVLKKMIDVKKSNIILSKSILNDKAAILNKEKLLSELTMEINHFKKENLRLKQDLEETEKIKAKCEQNEKGVKAYCSKLRGKFKDFVETVRKC